MLLGKSVRSRQQSFLKKDFAPYMEFLSQHLIKDASLSIDVQMQNSDMPVANQDEGFKVKVRGLGEQRITVKTDNLIKKVSAFHLIE